VIRAISIFSLVLFGAGLFMVRGAEAAIGSFTYGQQCVEGKANVNINWQGVDPGVTEVSLELSTAQSMTPILDTRTIEGRPTSYLWTGLDAHTQFWLRASQKQSNGDWTASAPVTFATACGTKPAHADAVFLVRGFTDKPGPNNAIPANVVVPGGTLSVCKLERLYIFTRYTGLDDLTDFIVTWTAPNAAVRTSAVALNKGEGVPFFVSPAIVTASEGQFSFKLTSGGEASPLTHINASINVSSSC
jgi:hypothetical protein